MQVQSQAFQVYCMSLPVGAAAKRCSILGIAALPKFSAEVLNATGAN